jgi:predicted nucleotidyltransferase
MAPSAPTALQRLVDLADAGDLAVRCEALDIELLVVFGSAADEARAERARDLDVAVLLGPDGDLLDVVNALIEMTGYQHVDVLDLGRAGPVAIEQALVDTLPLHERVPGTLAALRDRAIVRRMDTEWLRRLDLDLMRSR